MDDCDIFDEKEMKQRGTSVDSSSLRKIRPCKKNISKIIM
jgi:hypothetical protein